MKIISKKKDWFKVKRYSHIGSPLKQSDRSWVEKYVTNKDKIAVHSFLPFIHKTSKVKKFRKEYNLDDGCINKDYIKDGKVLRKSSFKKRELFYASHFDSQIFSYYANLLNDKYELKINSYKLDEVINAYRTIPVDPLKEDSHNKCNIDFANDVFKFISEYPQTKFYAIAFDISSFFDNLNHTLLRDAWCNILDEDKLPKDHYNVYKNITRFSYIDIVDIFEEFKDKIYTRKQDKFGKPLELKQKKVDKIKFLRNQNAIAFCTKQEFLKVKGKLLNPSKTRKCKDGTIIKRNLGIPQGSPISSVLANIYLLNFDKYLNDFVSSFNGIYRRYSDDMIIICPYDLKEEVENKVYTEIENNKLEIQKAKTQIFQFQKEADKLFCGQVFEKSINWNKNLIYLGFEFNGENVLLKSASLSGYYRKMKRAINRAKKFANYTKIGTSGQIFKRSLLKKFSYKGAKRIRKYLWNDKESKFIKSESYDWGNFLSYAYKASRIMINNKIKNQTKRHWNTFNKLIKIHPKS